MTAQLRLLWISTLGFAFALLALSIRIPTLGAALMLVVVVLASAVRWPSVPLALWQGAAIVGIVAGGALPRGATSIGFAAWVLLGAGVALLRVEAERPAFVALIDLTSIGALALTALLVLRLVDTPDPGYGSQKVQLWFTTLLVPFFAAIVVGSSARLTETFIRVVIVVGIGVALYNVFELVGGGAAEANAGRFTASASIDPIGLGRQMGEVIILLVAATIGARTGRHRLFLAALILVPAIALLASGSRGPLIGLVCALLVLTVARVNDPQAFRRLLFTLGSGLAVSAVAVALVVPPETTARALSAFGGSDASGESTTRAQLWQTLFDHLPTNLFDLSIGAGTGAFGKLEPVLKYPHNVPLELLYELGLAGLAVFTIAIVAAIVRVGGLALARTADSRLAAVVLALIVFTLVNAQFTGDVAGNDGLWLWAGLGSGLVGRLRRGPAAPPARM